MVGGRAHHWHAALAAKAPPPAEPGLGGFLTDLSNFGRKALRYTGAATVTVLTGGFVPQPFMRKTFGLSPGESAQSETALKVARGITTAVVAAGAATYAVNAYKSAQAAKLAAAAASKGSGGAVLSGKLSLAGAQITGAAPTFTSGAPIASSAAFGASASSAAAAGGGGFLSGIGKTLGEAFLLTKVLGSGASQAGQEIAAGYQGTTGQPLNMPGIGGSGVDVQALIDEAKAKLGMGAPVDAGMPMLGAPAAAPADQGGLFAGVSPLLLMGAAGVGVWMLARRRKA